jgi:hypothetical protein
MVDFEATKAIFHLRANGASLDKRIFLSVAEIFSQSRISPHSINEKPKLAAVQCEFYNKFDGLNFVSKLYRQRCFISFSKSRFGKGNPPADPA